MTKSKVKVKKPVDERRILRGSFESFEIEMFEAAIRASGRYKHDPQKEGCEDPNCPGWAVFSEYDHDPVFVCACDDCGRMSDEEAAAETGNYGIETTSAPRTELAASATLEYVVYFDQKSAYEMLFSEDAILFQVIGKPRYHRHGFLAGQVVEGVGFAFSPKRGLMIECFGEVDRGFVKKSQFVSFLNLASVTVAAEHFLRGASTEISEVELGVLEKIGYSSLNGVCKFNKLN